MPSLQTDINQKQKANGDPYTIIGIVKEVKKRDGRNTSFNILKIQEAANKALLATGEGTKESARSVAESVYEDLLEKGLMSYGYTPGVEYIQDLVEKHLQEQNYEVAAKAFIAYREEHATLREESKQRRLASGKLMVQKRNGKMVRLRLGQVEIFLRNCLKGFGNQINVVRVIPEILDEVRSNLFDGISTSEINESIILSLRARIERDPAFSDIAARVVLNEVYKKILNIDEFAIGFARTYRYGFARTIKRGVLDGRLDKKLLTFDLTKISNAINPRRDKLLKYLGIETLRDRYLIRDKQQNLLETPQYFWMRVAMGISFNESQKEEKAIEFYNLLSQLLFVSSSPTLFHSATTFPQLSSCYLNTVSDDLYDIFKTYSDNAQLSKYAGGIGTDWSNIRSTGALINTTNVPSQGVIPFLKIADSTTAAINRSGRRRGATCAYLETWHMDIESFLELRKNTGDERRRTHDMNTANWIPDLFMKRVIKNQNWTLFSPGETSDLHHLYGKKFETRYKQYEVMTKRGKIKIYKKIMAKDLWRKMLTMLYETGHPWITFKDPSNIRSPQDHVGVIHSSNLCTEITLNTSSHETAVCNLGSINLARHVSPQGKLNKKLLKGTISTAMRMLDNVIDVNYYPTKEAQNSNLTHRPVGLGIMGTQDVLFMAGIPFDTKEAVIMSDETMEYISFRAILASSRLAKERGAYASYKGSKWDRGIFPIDTISLLERERGEKIISSDRSKLKWSRVRNHVEKYGMRNSNCLAIAPTATISNISGIYPSIEPIYKNIYVKSNISGEFTVLNTYLVRKLKDLGLWSEEMLTELKQRDGDISQIKKIPARLREIYKEAFGIHPEWILTHAAARGKWMDQSQSVNIFVNTTSGKILSDIYISAWQKGLKTTYYLRTLGASTVEKSTVQLNGNSATTNSKSTLPATAVTTIACLLDEDCEACQ